MHTRCGVVELTGSVECVMETLSACPEARGDSHDLRLAPDSPHRDNAEHQEGQWLVMSLSCHCHVTVMSSACAAVQCTTVYDSEYKLHMYLW